MLIHPFQTFFFPSQINDSDSLFVRTIIPSPSIRKEFCACSGLKTLNLSKMNCPPSTARVTLGDGNLDVTRKILDKQGILLKDHSFHVNSQQNSRLALQADAPHQTIPYERGRELCETILNETDVLKVCKDALGEELWKKMKQICLQDAQVKT